MISGRNLHTESEERFPQFLRSVVLTAEFVYLHGERFIRTPMLSPAPSHRAEPPRQQTQPGQAVRGQLKSCDRALSLNRGVVHN